MIDALPFYAMLLDDEHRIITVNRATEQTLGVKREELLCEHCPQVVHGQDGPYEGCPLEEAMSTGRHVEVELFDEEHQRWLSSSVSPTDMETEDGHPVFLHFTQDIHDKKTADRELACSLEHHRMLAELLRRLQACTSGRHVLDQLIGLILDLSWSGLADSGAGFLNEGGALRLVAHRNLSSEVRQRCAHVPLGQCLCGEAAVSGEKKIAPCMGEDHTINADQPDHGHIILPLRHDDETLAVISLYLPANVSLEADKVAVLEIMTELAAAALERLRMQVQLAQSDRMASLGLLASILAHDIRTPLNSLSIQIQRIRRGWKNDSLDPAAVPGLLDGLEVEVQRINQQMEEHLLAMVRQQPEASTLVDANHVVAETVEYMEPEVEFSKVAIRLDRAAGQLPVQVEPRSLRRILLNLILNAVQSMPGGGEVRLETRLEGEVVLISVKDTGCGFDYPQDAELSLVHQQFKTTKEEGTGLGLAICARLIAELKGTIHCRSQPGQGATFHVRLPLARQDNELSSG